MKILSNTPREPVPAGKRSIRENMWGNTNAYVSGRFWMTLGPTYAVGTKEKAEDWLAYRDSDDTDE